METNNSFEFSSYDQWKQKLREDFKGLLLPSKEYSKNEKNILIESFINSHVRYNLRGYIGRYGDYGYHLRQIQKSLGGCFRSVKEGYRRAQEEAQMRANAALAKEHVARYPHFYDAEGIY